MKLIEGFTSWIRDGSNKSGGDHQLDQKKMRKNFRLKSEFSAKGAKFNTKRTKIDQVKTYKIIYGFEQSYRIIYDFISKFYLHIKSPKVWEKFTLMASSGKPKPWSTPENHNLLFPWMRLSWDEAFDVEIDGTGRLVDHMNNVFLGLLGGFVVNKKGFPASLTFCHRFKKISVTRRSWWFNFKVLRNLLQPTLKRIYTRNKLLANLIFV